MVDILPSELLNKIFSISPDLRKEYNLKEEFLEAAGTISRWRDYIVNSFIDDGYSNGFREGINNRIKVIKRNGFGYRSFKLLRKRILYIFNKKMK